MSNGIGGAITTNVFPGGGYAQSLTVSGCAFTGNQAVGGAGNTGGVVTGFGLGGGLASYLGAKVTVENSAFSGNQAKGSDGGAGRSGGDGLGGGLYNDGTSTLTITGSAISANEAAGGAGFPDGDGDGGGLYIDLGAIVSLDPFTVENTTGNNPDDIVGP
jgi:hypothetical protein